MALFPHKIFRSQIFNKKGFTPLQILKDSLLVICKLRSKDSDRLIDSHKKFVMGFTMIEIFVATLIIVALAGSLFSAFWGAQYSLNRARHRIQAYNFAIETVDRLRSNYGYSSSPSMDIGNDHLDTEIEAAGILKGELASLSGELTYDISEPQVNGYKQVTVKVHWDEPAF